MVTQLLRFETEDGGSVVVEVADDEPGVVAASRLGDTVADAARSFEEGIDRVRYAAAAAVDRLREMPRRPDEITMEFGVRFNAEMGAVIAKSGGEGHVRVTMAWHRREEDHGPGEG